MSQQIQANIAIQSPSLPQRNTTTIQPNLVKSQQRISTYRLVLGWAALIAWTVAILGIDWDVEWHELVGRDGFWTPPHWMFYGFVTLAGVICTIEVLIETFLYHRHYPGVDAKTTTPVLFFFHGPVGFMLAGFGMLVMLISAPFDDYWHRIYGIDLAIWSPFHVMLLIGMAMGSLGTIYLFASEVNRRRETIPTFSTNGSSGIKALSGSILFNLRQLVRPATLGLAFASGIFVTRYLDVFAETLAGSKGVGNLELFGAKFPAYSLVMATLPILLVGLAKFTERFGMATLAGLALALFRFGSDAFTNWGIQTLAVDQGRDLRGSSGYSFITHLYPEYLLLAGLLIDIIFLGTRHWRTTVLPQKRFQRNLWTSVAASLVGAVALFLVQRPWETYNDLFMQLLARANNPIAAQVIQSKIFQPAYWQALPLVLLLAFVGGILGDAFATSLHYTDR
jgi:hypothetical protein